MRVKLRLNAECHMEARCGPKPETGIQFDPPSRNLSVGSGAIMDGNSMHCPEFKCDYRLQLWHAEIEEQRRRIRMVRGRIAICWVELRIRNWVYVFGGVHLLGRWFTELLLKPSLSQVSAASGLKGWVKGVPISPTPPILLCFFPPLSVAKWSGLDSAFSAVEALAEVGLLGPQMKLPISAAVDASAIKFPKPIPSNRANSWTLVV